MEHQTHSQNTTRQKLNLWQITSFILGLILIIFVFFFFPSNSSATGKVISKEEAGKKLIDFAASQGAQATLVKVNEKGGMYEVVISVEGQEVPIYVSKDGGYFAQSLTPLSTTNPSNNNPQSSPATQTSSNAPKSDKPKVELFVMSHCPYGTQMEKGILPVVRELKDSIDFDVKFVNYAMHPGSGEVQEELNQYCIQKEQKAKYLDYLSCFLEKGDGAACLTKVNIDTNVLKACTEKTDKEFNVLSNLNDKSSWLNGRFPKFMIHDAENKRYGVQGSPTLVINGQQVQSGRNAQSILSAVCSSFTSKPAACDKDLTSYGNPAPGFGFDTQGGSASAAGCGV